MSSVSQKMFGMCAVTLWQCVCGLLTRCDLCADISYITFSKASEAALAIEETNGKCMFNNPRPLKVIHRIIYLINCNTFKVFCISLPHVQWNAKGSVFFCQSAFFCVIYLRNCWTDLCQICREDVFDPSLKRVWGHQGQKNGIFQRFWQPACGLCFYCLVNIFSV